jgi:hypothetical protein
VEQAALELGISFTGVDMDRTPPAVAKLSRPRIGLWDRYGGSMTSGWTRWILEQFEFDFQRVFAPELDAGNLNAKYDVLIFVSGAIPGTAGGRGGRGGRRGGGMANIPSEYRDQIGNVTAEATIPQLREFLEGGGRIVAIGSSAANLARHLDLPIENHLVQDGQPLSRTEYYAPGSVLQVRVDTNHPLAQGMNQHTDVFFNNSPVWALGPDAAAQNVNAVAWFDSPTPLRSGWAWGQHYLDKGVVAIEAKVGEGRVFLLGVEILQRAQPHGTFKFLFNAIHWRQP